MLIYCLILISTARREGTDASIYIKGVRVLLGYICFHLSKLPSWPSHYQKGQVKLVSTLVSEHEHLATTEQLMWMLGNYRIH